MLAFCAQLSFYLTFGEIEAKPSISPLVALCLLIFPEGENKQA
jgi:hypothetical protein